MKPNTNYKRVRAILVPWLLPKLLPGDIILDESEGFEAIVINNRKGEICVLRRWSDTPYTDCVWLGHGAHWGSCEVDQWVKR